MEKPLPFIRSQEFLLLDDGVSAEEFLKPEAFRIARWIALEKRRKKDQPDQRETGLERFADGYQRWMDRWQATTREALFADASLHRLCLTIDGGIGKTTTLKWAEAFLGGALDANNEDSNKQLGTTALHSSGRHLWLYLQMKDLPTSKDDFLSGPCLEILRASQFPGELSKAERERLDARIVNYLRRMVASGSVTFLIDGLDQTHDREVGNKHHPKIVALGKFLNETAGQCRAVVAGRPHSVRRHWKDLFENGNWRFAQMQGFTEEGQRRAYLGKWKFDKLNSLDTESLENPRMLEAVQRLPEVRLDDLHSPSELYAAVIDHVWSEDAAVDRTAGQSAVDGAQRGNWKERGLHLLSAVAMQMFDEKNWEGVAEGELYDFEHRLFTQRGAALRFASVDDLHQALVTVGETNSLLEYCFLDIEDQLTDIYFRDPTLHEFFVARYLAKHSEPEDCARFGRTPWLPGHDELNDDHLYRVWRFLAEMPKEHRTSLNWVRALAPLYAPRPELGLRSCEMLFRSWDLMESLAAYHVANPRNLPVHSLVARETLRQFCAEFSGEILRGTQGENCRSIAHRLVGDFVPIPPQYSGPDDLKFVSGSNPDQENNPTVSVWRDETQRNVQLAAPFELARTPVTSEQYELFEPKHFRSFQDRVNDVGELDQHPVVDVNWFQAVMFCRWLTGPRDSGDGIHRKIYRLPHELEWEFAARAGTQSIRFCCSDQSNLDEVRAALAKVANFGQDWKKGYTRKVGELAANGWGLHDIYGNVEEWCSNSYTDDPRETLGQSMPRTSASRVCRGGAWYYLPRSVRSAYRLGHPPTLLDTYLGFRVARAS